VKTDFVAKYKRSPTIAEIQNDPSIMVLPPEDRRRVGEEISASIAASQTFGLDAVSAEMTKWMKAVIIWQSTDQIKRAYSRRDIDEASRAAEEMVDKIKRARVDTRPSVNWRDWRNMLTLRQADYDNALTFGCTLFDRLLLSAGKGGSLVRGDTTLLLAATGGGKTSVSFTIAAANMIRQHPVLIVTHEPTVGARAQKMLRLKDGRIEDVRDNRRGGA
jgi:predicted ATP-dependent serine protease